MDGVLITGTAVSEWDRLVAQHPGRNIAMTTNALAAPTGSPLAVHGAADHGGGRCCADLRRRLGGGGPDPRPVHRRAAGGLRLTGLATMDVTVARPAQLEVLTGVRRGLMLWGAATWRAGAARDRRRAPRARGLPLWRAKPSLHRGGECIAARAFAESDRRGRRYPPPLAATTTPSPSRRGGGLPHPPGHRHGA